MTEEKGKEKPEEPNKERPEDFEVLAEWTIRRLRPLQEVSEEDVGLVMEQAGCTKEEAEKALKRFNGDIAAAILDLSEG